jgi:hypothetical protein
MQHTQPVSVTAAITLTRSMVSKRKPREALRQPQAAS